MKRFWYFALFSFLSFNVVTASPYSNLIVFGDSQSDIGNFPESSNLSNPQHIPYNLYVPFSNPVSTFKDPNLPTQSTINATTRQAFSRNWVEMLFGALSLTDAINQNSVLVPWIDVYTYHAPKGASVDYAVAGALSTNNCNNEAFKAFADSDCTEENFYATQALYRNAPENDQLRAQVVIPGTQKQIAFLAQDIKNQKVQVDANTLYIIWTGANDLALSLTNLLNNKNVGEFYRNITKIIPNAIAGPQDSVITQLYALGARNIIIISQPNWGLAPETNKFTGLNKSATARYINAYLLNLLIANYNLALAKNIAMLQKQYPDLSLNYIDTESLLNRVSMYPDSFFLATLGQACETQDDATYQALLAGNPVDCNHYLYWNASHMSNIGQAILSKAIWQSIAREDTPPQSD